MTQTLQSMRSIININEAKFETYSLQGKPQRNLSWCNISYDESTEQGCFLIRFAPGGISIPHEHLGYEEFLVLEGQVTECDGTIYKEGDFVCLKPGSKHYSVSETGCTSLVIVRGGFRTLDEREEVSG